MSYELFPLRRIKYYLEPSTGYAQSISGSSSASYTDIKVLEGATWGYTTEFVDNTVTRQRVDDVFPKIPVRRRTKIDFSSYLNGTNTAASKGVVAVTSPNGDMLKTIMGGELLTTGSGVVSATNGGQFIVDSLSNGQYYAGTTIGITNPNTGQLEVARIKNFNTSTREIFLHNQLTFTPTSGSTVYGAANYYFTQDPNTSFQFNVIGTNPNDCWVLLGNQGGFALKLELGKPAQIDYKLEGASFQTGSTQDIGIATYTDGNPVPFVTSMVSFYPINTNATTGSLGAYGLTGSVAAQSIEATPNIKYEPVMSPAGVMNIDRMRRVRSVPVCSGKVKILFADRTYTAARDAGTYYGETIRIGSTPGNTIAITAPKVQITDVTPADSSGMNTQEITFDFLEDDVSTATSGQTDICRSAFGIALL